MYFVEPPLFCDCRIARVQTYARERRVVPRIVPHTMLCQECAVYSIQNAILTGDFEVVLVFPVTNRSNIERVQSLSVFLFIFYLSAYIHIVS
jgi:hypothetical protein